MVEYISGTFTMDHSLKTVLTLGVYIEASSSVINKIQASSFKVIISELLVKKTQTNKQKPKKVIIKGFTQNSTHFYL